MAEGKCPEKVPEISTFIAPVSNTSLKRGIRLYVVPKLLVTNYRENVQSLQ